MRCFIAEPTQSHAKSGPPGPGAAALFLCAYRVCRAPRSDDWTCKRATDGAFVQIDFLLANCRLHARRTWCSCDIPIGVDHQCVHAQICPPGAPKKHQARKPSLKGWEPTSLDGYQRQLRDSVAQLVTFDCLEALRTWQANRLSQVLRYKCSWKYIRQIHRRSAACIQPSTLPPDDFAQNVELLFTGEPCVLVQPCDLSENPWTPCGLSSSMPRLRSNKSADTYGLVGELLKHAPPEFLEILLSLYNHVLFSGDVPETWRQTFFHMLAKKARARQVTDFRSIANFRLLYKVFSYMIFDRIEQLQPTWVSTQTSG